RGPGVSTALHLSHHRRSGVETDPQMRSDALFCFEFRSGGPKTLENRQSRATSPQRRVFECNRGAEDRHNAVAGKALYDAALLAHRVVHQPREAAHQRESGFLSRPFRERGEVHHIGEQNSDLPAFSFHVHPPRVEKPKVSSSFDAPTTLAIACRPKNRLYSRCGANSPSNALASFKSR